MSLPTKATEIWELSRSGWQSQQGVHEPWIGEISPMQYGLMSKRQRAAYDARRKQQWAASAECGEQYERACHAAYQADLDVLVHPDLHPDAKAAISRLVQRAETELLNERMAQARRENMITRSSELEIGDRVYWLMGCRYVTVEKKLKASFDARDDAGKQLRVKAEACQWLHYNELTEAVAADKPVRPVRACHWCKSTTGTDDFGDGWPRCIDCKGS